MELTEIKPSHPNFFEQLPIEMVGHIYQFLSLEEAAALAKTNAKIQKHLLSFIINDQRTLFTRIGVELGQSFAFINEKFSCEVKKQTETSLALLTESDSLKKVREISLQLKHGIIKAALGSEAINDIDDDLDHDCPWLEPHLYLEEIFQNTDIELIGNEFSWRLSKATEELMRSLPDNFTEKMIGFAENGEFNKKGGILYTVIWEGLDLSNQQQAAQALRLAQKIEDVAWRNEAMLAVLKAATNIGRTFLSGNYLQSLDEEAQLEALRHLLSNTPIETLDEISAFSDTTRKKKALVPCFDTLHAILLSGYEGIQKLANLISPLSEEGISPGLFPLFKTLEGIYRKHSANRAYFVRWINDLQGRRRGIFGNNPLYLAVITIVERQVAWGESTCLEMFERSFNLLHPLTFDSLEWRQAMPIIESFRMTLSHTTSKNDASKILELFLQKAKELKNSSYILSKMVIRALVFDLLTFIPNFDLIDVPEYTNQLAELIKEIDPENRAVLESELLSSFPRLRQERYICLRLYILAGIVDATFAPGEKKEEISELIIQEWNHFLKRHPQGETVNPPQLIMRIIKGITDPERKMRVILSLRNYDFYTVVAGGYFPLLTLLERLDLIEDAGIKKRLQKVFFEGWLLRISQENETTQDAMISILKAHIGHELFQECLIQSYVQKNCFFGRLEYLSLSFVAKLWKEVDNPDVRDEAISYITAQALKWDPTVLVSDDFKQFVHELGKDLIVNPETKAQLIKFVVKSLEETRDLALRNLAYELSTLIEPNEGPSNRDSLPPGSTNLDNEGFFPWS